MIYKRVMKMTIVIEEDELLELLESHSYTSKKGRREFRCKTHQIFWEIANNKRIPKGYVLHHIDKDKTNNSLDNLRLMTRGDHMSLHHKGRPHSEETKKRIGEANKGKTFKNYARVVSKGKNWTLYGPGRTYIKSNKNKEMLEMMADEMNSF